MSPGRCTPRDVEEAIARVSPEFLDAVVLDNLGFHRIDIRIAFNVRGRPPAWALRTRAAVERRLAQMADQGHNMTDVARVLGWEVEQRPDGSTACQRMKRALKRGRAHELPLRELTPRIDDKAARRRAAQVRWERPEERDAQAEVLRRTLKARYTDEGARQLEAAPDARLEDPMTSLEEEAARRGIRPPALSTLRRYGITRDAWLALLAGQGWKCAVCLKTGPTVKWNTDHDHVPMWAKRPPEERARYVRGVLCVFCNFRRVNSRMPAAEARRIAEYLEAYEERRGS